MVGGGWVQLICTYHNTFWERANWKEIYIIWRVCVFVCDGDVDWIIGREARDLLIECWRDELRYVETHSKRTGTIRVEWRNVGCGMWLVRRLAPGSPQASLISWIGGLKRSSCASLPTWKISTRYDGSMHAYIIHLSKPLLSPSPLTTVSPSANHTHQTTSPRHPPPLSPTRSPISIPLPPLPLSTTQHLPSLSKHYITYFLPPPPHPPAPAFPTRCIVSSTIWSFCSILSTAWFLRYMYDMIYR